MSSKRRVFEDLRYVHFVTFSCFHRRKLLSHDRICQVVLGNLREQLVSFNAACVGFVLMPDHVHGLFQFAESGDLGRFIQRWKSRSSYFAKQLFADGLHEYAYHFDGSSPFWQRKYYDFPIESREKLLEKLQYIHENPVRAGLVTSARDWRWSSARWYELRKSVGVPITWID
ncbi:REP-associated tyrosine transposase [Rubinisphaera margarita]|uniref:REP-associated tyrosine transposase n=1 Tax=Rubinisphaera margarita TaxID=2909586 RepID=UPI001EE97F62|nr:transposase [Rubinisphaera margarita]MCG6155710.1 transposase [Rubinisphaera margarita]